MSSQFIFRTVSIFFSANGCFFVDFKGSSAREGAQESEQCLLWLKLKGLRIANSY